MLEGPFVIDEVAVEVLGINIGDDDVSNSCRAVSELDAGDRLILEL